MTETSLQTQTEKAPCPESEVRSLDPRDNRPSPGVQPFGFKIQESKFKTPDSELNCPHSLTPRQLQFLLRIVPAARASEREHEIPAPVTIAQAILESATPKLGWGSSPLFRLANNPFGIKFTHRAIGLSGHSNDPMAKSPDGPMEDYGHFDAPTWEMVDGRKMEILAQFQRFPTLVEAFRAHARLLLSPRYRPAYEVRHDWKQFAERLGPKISERDPLHCGYSTNPSYSALLTNLVRAYRLDDPRMLTWLETGRDPGREAVSSQLSAVS